MSHYSQRHGYGPHRDPRAQQQPPPVPPRGQQSYGQPGYSQDANRPVRPLPQQQWGTASYVNPSTLYGDPNPATGQRLPQPLYPVNDHAASLSNSYHGSPASPRLPVAPTYNPRDYAPLSPPSSPPLRSGFPPQPPRQQPQPYDPAAYQNTTASIAGAVDKMFGPVSSNTVPAVSYSRQQEYGSYEPQPMPMPSASTHRPGPRTMPQGPGSIRSARYGATAPLPQQPFQHFQEAAHNAPPAPQRQDTASTRYSSAATYANPPSSQPSGPRPSAHLQSIFTSESSRSRPYSFQLPIDTPLDSPRNPFFGRPQADADEPNWSQYNSHSQGSRHSHDDFQRPRRGSSREPRPPDLASHTHSRPLPGLPVDIEPDDQPTHRASDYEQSGLFKTYSDNLDQEELIGQIEAELGASPASQGHRLSSSAASTAQQQNSSRRVSLSASGQHSRAHSNRSDTSDRSNMRYRLSAQSSPMRRDDTSDADDSDAEAAAGLEAMRIAAEEERAQEQRRTSFEGPQFADGAYQASRGPQRAPTDETIFADDDNNGYGHVDISSFGGGYDMPMADHVDDPLDLIANHYNKPEGVQGQHPSTSSNNSHFWSNPERRSSESSLTAMSLQEAETKVDQSGTGGFADPDSARRMSYDEGIEEDYYEPAASAGASMTGPPLGRPYNRASLTDRPLPPVPPSERLSPGPTLNQGWQGQLPGLPAEHRPRPFDPSTFQPVQADSRMSQVLRAQSMQDQPPTPKLAEPARHKTDGAVRRLPKISTSAVPTRPKDELETPAVLDLPLLPRDSFRPSRLTQRDFDRCTQPWALSDVGNWLRMMASGEPELKQPAIFEALTMLFTNCVPDMNITLAETLAAIALTELYAAQVLISEEEWLRFGAGTASGVLFQLTGKGCYAPSVHDFESHDRCYAPTCQRTVRKLDLATQERRQGADWASFYNLAKADIEHANKKDIELQNNLHEIVASEDTYMDQLYVLCVVYRDALRTANPPIITPHRLPDFLKGVFGKVDAVKACNEEHLLPQLRYRQQEQGPWISGFADIFRHWIRKAKTSYIEYAAAFPHANFLMKQEETRNSMFVAFVEGARNNKLSQRLNWDSFLKSPITRLQRYGLLLREVQKNTPADRTEELQSLQKALEEIKAVTLECDARVAEKSKQTEMFDLQTRLVLRPDMRHVELNLTHLGRELLHKGDLQRPGQNKFSLVQTHAILLDNYMVLAKTVDARKDAINASKYDVSKMPIPMDLLILESTNDEPVRKSYGSGIKPVSGTTRPVPYSSETRTRRAGSSTNNTLTQVMSSESTAGRMGPSVDLSTNSADGEILYPFRIKHLGRETYTLLANSGRDRDAWCDKILQAKTRHASSLFAQNAEPFKLRILADSAFSYDPATAPHNKAPVIKGTPLERAIADVDRIYGQSGRPAPICRAHVNCATSFRPPHGRQMLAVGTDYGVYMAEAGDVRGWIRAISAVRVSQLMILEDFNLLVLISDRSLIAYHLDTIVSSRGSIGPHTGSSESHRKAPQKLSGTKDVSFFTTGRLKDRTLIFYKKASSISSSSTFKILEPVLHRISDKSRHRAIHARNGGSDVKSPMPTTTALIETFRDYDDFYIPSDSTALELFNNTLAVATTKGFEVLNLDKKTPFSVPDLKTSPDVATIARRLEMAGQPRAMFRLTPDDFLCVYEECAVYVNKHGDVNRSVVMEFVGRARSASLVTGKGAEKFLVLFDDDFVEVRDANTGRLKQIVAGRDVRCLDDGRSNGGQQFAQAPSSGGYGGYGSNGAGLGVNGIGVGMGPGGGLMGLSGVKNSVKFALQHPELDRVQLLVELVLDESRM